VGQRAHQLLSACSAGKCAAEGELVKSIDGRHRAYIIGEDKHVRSRIDLLCPDDESAKTEAKQLVDGHSVELWLDTRRVAIFTHKA